MNLAVLLHRGWQEFPNAVAIIQGEVHLTYSQAYQDVERIAAHLFAQGVRPGHVVGTDLQRPISHWLVLLALLRIGATSVSLTTQREAEAAALRDLAFVVQSLTDSFAYRSDIGRIDLGRTWLQIPPGCAADLPEPLVAAQTAGRICFTSGTAGKAKAIRLTADLLHARLVATARRTLISTRSVLWCGLGPDTAYGLTATLATWAAGGTVVFSRGGDGAFRTLSDLRVNLIVASPAALATLLRDANSGDLPGLHCDVIVAGGRLQVGQRDALLARLCTAVYVAYGASETGGVTLGDAAGLDHHAGHVGQVFDDVDVRIVDDLGTDQPIGTTGQIRLRSSSTVGGYLNDHEASQSHFDAGWFVPGDLGQLSANRALTVVGRPVDILNLGGIKLSATEIDAAARDLPGIVDVCAIVLTPETTPQLAVVIVGSLSDPAAFATALRARLHNLPRMMIVAATAIPRGSMGKVNRLSIAEAVNAGLNGTQIDPNAYCPLGYY
ncbi:MAG: class I adenylate-forming enzyme family protein [bacterium]